MAIPLSDLLNAKGDADYAEGGYGAPAPVYNNALTQSYLQQLGDMQSRANQYILEQHDQNLRTALSGLSIVDFTNLTPTDRAALMDQYKGVLKDTANNFSTIRNPMSNPDAWASLQSGEADFRGKLSQSQQDAAYLAKQREFVQQHPEYNTPEFQQNVNDFLSTPVGQRKYFTPTPPMIFNPEAMGKTFGDIAKAKYANASSDGKYITTEDGEKIDPDKYFALWANPGQDQYGRQIESTIKNSYDTLPKNLKSLYKDYSDYKYQMAVHNMPGNIVSKKTVSPDEFATIDAQGKQARQTEAMREKNQDEQNGLNRAIEWARVNQQNAILKNGQLDKDTLGAYKNNLYYNLTNGKSESQNIPNETLQGIYGNNDEVEVKTGNAMLGEPVVTVKKPSTSVIGNYVEDGKVVVELKDNKTGKRLPRLHIPFNQVYNDLDGVTGSKNAPAISQASREWLKKNTGSETPDATKLGQLFNPAKSSYLAPDGKSYSMDQLKTKYGYTDEQIQSFITAGVLK